MPDTLKKYPGEDRAFRLAQASKELLPDPGLEETDPEEEVWRRESLKEIADQLDVDNPYEGEGRSRVLNYVNQEVHDLTLAGKDRDAIRDRLGARGDLAPRHYRREISTRLKKKLPNYGLTPNMVSGAMRSPDKVQHLKKSEAFPDSPVSFFVDQVKRNQRNAFSLLVQVLRKGGKLEAEEAWRVYHSDFDLPSEASPLQLLKAFTDRYGIEFNLKGTSGVRLLTNTTIRLPNLNKEARLTIPKLSEKLFGFQFEEGPPAGRATFLYAREENDFHIHLAYGIWEEPYLEDLKRHGVVFYG